MVNENKLERIKTNLTDGLAVVNTDNRNSFIHDLEIFRELVDSSIKAASEI